MLECLNERKRVQGVRMHNGESPLVLSSSKTVSGVNSDERRKILASTSPITAPSTRTRGYALAP